MQKDNRFTMDDFALFLNKEWWVYSTSNATYDDILEFLSMFAEQHEVEFDPTTIRGRWEDDQDYSDLE